MFFITVLCSEISVAMCITDYYYSYLCWNQLTDYWLLVHLFFGMIAQPCHRVNMAYWYCLREKFQTTEKESFGNFIITILFILRLLSCRTHSVNIFLFSEYKEEHAEDQA